MTVSKREAFDRAIALWRAKPPAERNTYKQALEFAAELVRRIEFETLGDKQRIIEGWLVKDIDGQPNVARIGQTRVSNGAEG